MPKWWNGRRAGLKIQLGQPSAGSSPAFGTIRPVKVFFCTLLDLNTPFRAPTKHMLWRKGYSKQKKQSMG